MHDDIKAILDRLENIPNFKYKGRTLVVIMGLLGDFDSLEYAQSIVRETEWLKDNKIEFHAFAICNEEGRRCFCDYTDFPIERLHLLRDSDLHNYLELNPGLNLPIANSLNLILMCAGIASQGTISEVLRGYLGDKSASSIFNARKSINFPSLPPFNPLLFDVTFGKEYQRPFELASLRLLNMIEVIQNWNKYMFDTRFLTQRGGTYLLEGKNIKYIFKPKALLRYSSTMNKPLAFLRRNI